ncbi:MAG: hypothetical protein WC683_10340 [bacterium]
MTPCVIVVQFLDGTVDVVGPFQNDQEAHEWRRMHPAIPRGLCNVQPIEDPASYSWPRRRRRRRTVRLIITP